ncbi:protein SDA1-like protein [Corchorus olitorius]|uniref:Protein SDA1-like protein n=1 Tax=Corchorus olitorius TaxID=93759 RepID=A0A1R3HAF8_9ROSI|nr:protein SDA1-like protein [Corchorus olitorius]
MERPNGDKLDESGSHIVQEKEKDHVDNTKIPRSATVAAAEHGFLKKNSEVFSWFLQIPEEDMDWIERSAVRPLGGCSFLLTFENKEVLEFYIKEHEAWFSTWFTSIQPCNGNTCSNEKMVFSIRMKA